MLQPMTKLGAIAEKGDTSATPRILIVGCGAIGGSLAASLIYQGHDVTALTRNESICDAVNLHGFRTQGESSLGSIAGQARTRLKKNTSPFDWVLLCTQPPQVEEAAREVAAHLKVTGNVVCFQNGLCEERVAAIVGEDRVVGGVVSWGASMPEAGVYDRTSAGGFVVGRPRPSNDPRLHELARMLECMGPVEVSDNLLGARWSKLAINCAISSLGTVGGDRLGALLRRRFVRRLALEVFSETVAVARCEGVRLERVAGTLDLEWLALTDEERNASLGSPRLLAKHALLLAVGTRYRRLRSSMLRAIERGRAPAVDFLNGEVTERGKRHGIATPINQALQDEVLRIAKGKARPSIELLQQLFENSRRAAQQVPVPSVPPPALPKPPADFNGSPGDAPTVPAATNPAPTDGGVPADLFRGQPTVNPPPPRPIETQSPNEAMTHTPTAKQPLAPPPASPRPSPTNPSAPAPSTTEPSAQVPSTTEPSAQAPSATEPSAQAPSTKPSGNGGDKAVRVTERDD
jgi:2-dehydropantoate 2-reductase